MTTKVLNPDSKILQQSEGQWQKLLMLVVWKLAPQGVEITAEDMQKCMQEHAAGGGPALLTHGHENSIEYRVITFAEAERLAKLDGKPGGRA